MLTPLRLTSVLVLVLALAGCSSEGPASAIIVAAEGGSVISESVTLTIPASSLSADTEVVVSQGNATDVLALEGGQSTILRIEPEGTVLERAATVVIDSSFVDGSTEAAVRVYQLRTVDGESWQPVESSRDASGAVSVSIDRFAPLGLVVTEPGTTGTIQGVLSWGDASVVDGAPMELWSGDVMVGTTTTDATGAFSFAGLDAGTYSVQVDYECMLTETVELTAGATETLALTLCGG